MFKIFTTEKGLEDICLEEMDKPFEKQRDWFKIFTKQNEINISSDNQDYEFDEEDPLFIFSQSYGIEIKDSTDFINDILSDDKNVLREPSSAYLLDITSKQASDIQNKYGVICQSLSYLSDGVLTRERMPFTPARGEYGYGWKRVLSQTKEFPSNALLIIDRNLFANDSNVKMNGIENIYEILDSILPISSTCEFFVSLFVEYGQIKNGLTFSKVSTLLNKLKSRLNRNYIITIELIGLKKGSEYFGLTHNRRIFSNFFFITADWRLNAFDNDISLSTQIIAIQTFYSSGLDGRSDSPIKHHLKMLRDFRDFIGWWKNHPDMTDYEIAINGNCKVGIENYKNRLLT